MSNLENVTDESILENSIDCISKIIEDVMGNYENY